MKGKWFVEEWKEVYCSNNDDKAERDILKTI